MTQAVNRRKFISQAGCGAYVLGLASACPAMTQKVFNVQEKEKVVFIHWLRTMLNVQSELIGIEVLFLSGAFLKNKKRASFFS